MKLIKNFLPALCLMVIFMAGTVIRSYAQETLPYSTDFSNANGWLFENGDCTNAWHIGTPAGHTGNALFVSRNGQDTTFAYDKPSRVFAKKLFRMGSSERITVEFDINVGGGYYGTDYVKVYVMDTNQIITASSSTNYGEPSPFDFPDYPFCGEFRGMYGISLYNGHVSMQIPNPAKGGCAFFVIMWRNGDHYQESYATQPAPIVTNLSLKETPDSDVRLEMPKNLNFSIGGIDTALVTWMPGRDEKSWEFKLGENGSIGTVSQRSDYILTGLTNHQKYTFYVRAKNGNFFSEWNRLEIDFNTDPSAWTHGPDTIAPDFARLTGAVSYYTESLKPKAFGLLYKKTTDEKWIYLKANIRDTWEGQYEIDAPAENLEPFTWYAVGAWAVSRTGDTILTGTEYPHSFLTYDNAKTEAATLPYTATFGNNDHWGLSKGLYNWYKGSNGNSGNRLFISPNGTDTAYNGTPIYVNSFAQKKIGMPKNGYITVKINAKKDGCHFMGYNISNLYAALSRDSIGGFHPWFESKQDLNNMTPGEYTFHLKVPQSYGMDSTGPVYLVFGWEDMYEIDAIGFLDDIELGAFAAIIGNISVEETPEETARALDNCHTPVISEVDLTSFTTARVYWEWENQPCQYQVEYGDGRTSPVTDCNENSSNMEVTGLVPNSTAVFKLRVLCQDSTWGDWTRTEINTKALPEVYVMPVNDVSENSANIHAYLFHGYINFNPIREFGFEYAEPATTNMLGITEVEWTKLPCNRIDTIYDESIYGGYSLMYKLYTSIEHLEKNKTYMVREYATTANGVTTYSEERTFTTGTVRIGEAGENIRMSVSPNPADDYAEVRLEGLHGNATVCLSDMQGRLVYKQQVADAAQTLRINTQMLSSGLYIIKVQTQAGYGIAKIAIR